MDSPASGMAHGGWFRSYDSDWDQYGKSDSDSVNEHVPADGHDTDTDSDTDGEEDGAQGKNRHPEDVPGMASFIMNQKSLADKAPGAQQNSFAHRTIELPYPAHVRIVQLCVVLLTGLLTAGIPFGLPALRQVMIESSIYDDLCEGRSSDSKRVGCSAQEARLAILQVSGWVSWMIGGWLAARSVERLGPRATGIVGSGVVMAGAVLLATIMPEEDGSFLLPLWMRFYNIPVVIMSVGSVFVLLACLHYVRLFPKRTSLLHSLVFLSHDMSSLLFYVFYECRKLLSLQGLLCVYAGVMGCQMLLWFLVFSPDNIPTMRFTVTTWHQRPLMVDLSRQRHISSPYFLLALTLSVVVLLKLFFYMSTFQVQLRLLLTPTTRHIAPEDFVYHADDVHLTSNPSNFLTPQDSPHFTSPSLSYSDDMREGQRAPVRPTQSFSYVPFFAEQPGEGSSTVLALRQFTYNPMQPELFLTDLQEMLYFLLPIASLMTIFWMRAAMADRKLSTALHLSLVSLIVWGLVQYAEQMDVLYDLRMSVLSLSLSLVHVETSFLSRHRLWRPSASPSSVPSSRRPFTSIANACKTGECV